MHIPVRSPWLPGYVNVAQTVLVILTMAGLFPDGPHIAARKLKIINVPCIIFLLDFSGIEPALVRSNI